MVHPDKDVMLSYPNAKINLGLAVMNKRLDGYHNLETIFLPVVGLADELEVVADDSLAMGEFRFVQEGLSVDCPDRDNLIIRAYLRMQAHYPQIGPVRIRFRKNIPFGAGLGGGSADAAFMARSLNQLFALGLTDEQLEQEVSPLGADCAFFIQNRPRFAEGIGNEFTDVCPEVLESVNGHYLVLIKPTCSVSTAAAYRGIIVRGEQPGIRGVSRLQELSNDFEKTVFPLFPAIAQVKQTLLDTGAFYASMSGSGATVFGLYDAPQDVDALRMRFPGCFVWTGQMKF